MIKHPAPASSASAKPKTKANTAAKPSDSGFAYTLPFFESLVDVALAEARKAGATDAGAEVSEGCGLSVSVRNGELENVERNRDKSLGVTVYVGQRRGNASTSDFSHAAIAQTVRAAYDIARFTAEDPFASLPDEADIAPLAERGRALDLFHPWAVSSEQAAALALQCEAAALGVDKRITNSEGAAVSAQQSQFFSAHTHGFRGGYASSRHSMSVSPIAGKGRDMQRDSWYSSMRHPEALARLHAELALVTGLDVTSGRQQVVARNRATRDANELGLLGAPWHVGRREIAASGRKAVLFPAELVVAADGHVGVDLQLSRQLRHGTDDFLELRIG